MQPVEPILTVDLYPELHVELLALLRALPLEDWEKPTAAVPWTVRDMAAHLLDTDMRRLSRQRDKLPPLKPDKPIENYGDLVAFINQLNNDWVRVARRISPALMIDLLALVGPQVHTFFKTLDPYAPSPGAVSWAGPEVAPNWFDLAREYTEKWHHQMHIREAVGAPELELTSRRLLHPVLDTFVRALPHTYRDIASPEGTQVVLEITGEAGDTWSLVREGSGWRLYQGSGSGAAAQVQMGQDTAWRLFTKGLALAEARERTRISGDEGLGGHLLNAVAIIA
jgi:uncharacterized protein (TIGR03083 family)